MNQPDFGVKGLRVLVTASSRGIGYGVARVLASMGARIVINGRNPDRLQRSVDELRKTSSEVYGVPADISRREEALMLVDKAAELLGGLDSLVYITGPPRPGFFMELNEDDWRHGVDLLIMSAIWVTRRSIEYLMKSDNPSITYLTSIAVREPIPNIALSNTLRIAVHGLVKTLAGELGPKGIRVNAILPGYIYTDRVEQLIRDKMERYGKKREEVLEEITSSIPLRRIGRPEEVGYLVAFLISPYASYIHGASIPIDGGRLKSIF